MHFEFEENNDRIVRIKAVGVGGGGGNALNTMIENGIASVDFVAANTDAQALKMNKAQLHLQLGRETTKGLGAGANPAVGQAAAEEDAERVREALAGADMVFVTCGMGGGTGTGAAPVVARIARELGALVVGVVTRPFVFEGPRRSRQAEQGIAGLRANVDALITIPNMKLLQLAGRNMGMTDAFKKADDVLHQAVKAISEIITVNGLINVDFADVRTIMSGMGRALMGAGSATGERRAVEAAQKAVNSPLLDDVSIHGAKGVLINISGSSSLSLAEVNEAATLIQEAADPDANIIFGAVIDESLGEEVRVTVIATGFDGVPAEAAQRRPERLTLPVPAAHPRGPDASDPTLSLSVSAPTQPSASSLSASQSSVSAPFGTSQPGQRRIAVGGRPQDLDVPTVIRKEREPLRAGAARGGRQAIGLARNDGEIDIPTFLRRRVELSEPLE